MGGAITRGQLVPWDVLLPAGFTRMCLCQPHRVHDTPTVKFGLTVSGKGRSWVARYSGAGALGRSSSLPPGPPPSLAPSPPYPAIPNLTVGVSCTRRLLIEKIHFILGEKPEK